MRPTVKFALMTALLVSLLIGVVLMRRNAPPRSASQLQAPSTQPKPAPSSTPASVADGGVAAVLGRIQNAQGSKDKQAILTDLRKQLSTMEPEAASAELKKYLASKKDADTGLGMKLARDGSLDSAPTMRTFALDQLSRIDPAAAAGMAKEILQNKDSADEWAVSMRSYAKGTGKSESKPLLVEKMRELLNYEPWRNNPSVGFLEAFDVGVYLGGTDLLPEFTQLVRQKDNKALSHAAFLALDRLAQTDTPAVLAQLQAHPEMMEGREITRANFFARADIRDAEQQRIIENYLLDPKFGSTELDTFAGMFPSGNFMISHNLLTTTETPTRATQAAQDQHALEQIKQWISDPRFGRARPHLEKIKARLQNFVQAQGQQ